MNHNNRYFILKPEKFGRMTMRVVRAQLYSGLKSTEHDGLDTLEGVSSCYNVVPSFFVQ